MTIRSADLIKEDLPSLGMLLLLLLTSATAIAAAEWADGLWLLPTIALVALVLGYFLAVSLFPNLLVILFSTIYGLFTIWAIVGQLLPRTFTFRQRMYEISIRFAMWVEQAIGGGFSRDNLIFVLLLGIVFWLLAFNAVINLFRSHRLWLAMIPPGLALLLNAYYYYGPVRLEIFLIFYLFVAFTLAVRTNAVTRERGWRRQRVGFTPGIRFDLLRGGMIAIVIVLLIAWAIPAASASNQLASAWERSVSPWMRVQDTFNRLFGALRGGGSTAADYYGGATLSLGGPINLGNNTVMYVYAPRGYRYYWRSKTFDTYESGRWITDSEARITSDFGILKMETETGYAMRRNVQQRFEIVIPVTRLLYAAPQPLSFASLPLAYDAIYTAPGKEYASVMAIRATDVLTSGRSYGVTSSISVADASSLRAAGTTYPRWVSERYLQLPETITQRTTDLANILASPHDNPYDIARAIEGYLRENIAYNEQIDAPPRGVDPVDYFLFESREGYCNYYASAMVIMLRTQGIPARVAAGFSQGTRDPDLDAYRVIESNAHTWVEVYFPRYGWVEFEPTASESPIVRPDVRSSSSGGMVPGRTMEPDGGLDDNTPDQEPPPLPDDRDDMYDMSDLSQGGSRISPVVWWGLGGLLLLVVGGVGGLLYIEQRGLWHLSRVSRSYARLNIYAPLVGLRMEKSETPYERGERIGQVLPDGRGPVDTIVQLYVEEKFAPPPPTSLHADRANSMAQEAWGEARRAFLREAALRFLRRLNPFRDRQKGEA